MRAQKSQWVGYNISYYRPRYTVPAQYNRYIQHNWTELLKGRLTLTLILGKIQTTISSLRKILFCFPLEKIR